MKVSIITTSYNSELTIRDTLQSVASQSMISQIEHIVVDGHSNDSSVAIIKSFEHISRFISEPDNGIYDAMNKGVNLATGDVIGFLNSDDFFTDSLVIEKIIKTFEKNKVDAVYGDLFYVHKKDKKKVTRKWFAGGYTKERFLKGWMPPHPTFYVKKEVFIRYGNFNLELKSAADYELMLRFLYKYNILASYIPYTLVMMREGGISNSSILNRLKANQEDSKAWKINGLKPKFYTKFLKPITKIKQFIGN